MKLIGFIICICVAQQCSSPIIKELEDSTIQSVRKHMSEIMDVSPQFTEDVDIVLEEFASNVFVVDLLDGFMEILSREMDGRKSKIDMCHVKQFLETFKKDSMDTYKYAENLVVLDSVLSKTSSSESTKRLKGLIRAFRPDSTPREALAALEYLYGTETNNESSNNADMPIPLDCELNPTAVKELSLIVDIRPEVVKDIENISKKFPCNEFVRTLTHDLKGRRNKVDFHSLSRFSSSFNEKENELNKEIKILETILSTRMSKEETENVLSFVRALHPDATARQMEAAIEYLYGAE